MVRQYPARAGRFKLTHYPLVSVLDKANWWMPSFATQILRIPASLERSDKDNVQALGDVVIGTHSDA